MSRRIDDHDVAHVVDSVLDRALRDLDGMLAVAAEHADALLVAKRLQLVGSSRAVHVACGEQRNVPSLLEAVGEF